MQPARHACVRLRITVLACLHRAHDRNAAPSTRNACTHVCAPQPFSCLRALLGFRLPPPRWRQGKAHLHQLRPRPLDATCLMPKRQHCSSGARPARCAAAQPVHREMNLGTRRMPVKPQTRLQLRALQRHHPRPLRRGAGARTPTPPTGRCSAQRLPGPRQEVKLRTAKSAPPRAGTLHPPLQSPLLAAPQHWSPAASNLWKSSRPPSNSSTFSSSAPRGACSQSGRTSAMTVSRPGATPTDPY